MRNPSGLSADETDKVMLLAMWANTLHKKNNDRFIFAGMGKPTFPIHQNTILSYLTYWQDVGMRAKATMENAAVDYCDPRGDECALQIMADAMSRWYNIAIKPDNILFTVGGAGGLRVIFETFNLLYKERPPYRVVTPFPHYTLYADNQHQLHPVDVMKNNGYRLTAESLKTSIDNAYELAKKDYGYPKIVLICNPNNPLGNVISEEELLKIADVLRLFPELYIVLDEAYAEMCFTYKKAPSFLTVAPDLKNRIVILRSATKALSAAGERMAVLITFNAELMGRFLNKNISMIGHAPRSAQIVYAETMLHFSDEIHQQLIDYYQPKVNYVMTRLRDMGAAMPDKEYFVDSTFYALGDFGDLFGLQLPEEAYQALEKKGVVTTDEELAYYLLFKELLMIAPLSYFGLHKKNGFMRITCSGSASELNDLMNRLEACLLEARRHIKMAIIHSITQELPKLYAVWPERYDEIMVKLTDSSKTNNESCLVMKGQIQVLKEMQATIMNCLSYSENESAQVF